jgi:hypothetical protein
VCRDWAITFGLGHRIQLQQLTPDQLTCRNFKVCHKCAVRFEPLCANVRFFNTLQKCFRAGICCGKSLILHGEPDFFRHFIL